MTIRPHKNVNGNGKPSNEATIKQPKDRFYYLLGKFFFFSNFCFLCTAEFESKITAKILSYSNLP